ncbi:putative glutathione-specific gamma-glutamylcyclotransferase 2 isoform X1 [Scylla paramamosain]|uniref:putative glutathione-specific gamma-glutamylcyclotransferase 2 isoform X1 n=1 Tax=Scylla paramamosain TaxID=85552 RepID=UPI0030836A1D
MAGQQQETRSLWVFGYGSLCWMPGFQFGGSAVGYIQDYVRRFWQGNTTHRGTPAQPGRVATLVEEKEGCTWGVAYELKGEAALQYLEKREVALGGYNTSVVTFFPRDPNMQPFPVLLFIATPSSRDWAGQAPLHEIATQVVRCSGPSGHNVEYVLRLAEFMRVNVPEGYDEHLATLESLIRQRVKQHNLCLKTLMGDGPSEPTPAPHLQAPHQPQDAPHAPPVQEERRDTFQYSTKLPPKKLRCLNV